jgi:hypothetical protein
LTGDEEVIWPTVAVAVSVVCKWTDDGAVVWLAAAVVELPNT